MLEPLNHKFQRPVNGSSPRPRRTPRIGTSIKINKNKVIVVFMSAALGTLAMLSEETYCACIHQRHRFEWAFNLTRTSVREVTATVLLITNERGLSIRLTWQRDSFSTRCQLRVSFHFVLESVMAYWVILLSESIPVPRLLLPQLCCKDGIYMHVGVSNPSVSLLPLVFKRINKQIGTTPYTKKTSLWPSITWCITREL